VLKIAGRIRRERFAADLQIATAISSSALGTGAAAGPSRADKQLHTEKINR